MLRLTPAFFLALALPLMLGYLLPAVPSTSPRQSLAWRLLLGLCALIITTTYAGALTASHTYAPYVALLITLFFLSLHRARAPFLHDLRQLLPRLSSWLAALLAAVVIFLTLYPILGSHHYINFGGTLNNDNYAYVGNIEYIQHTDYLHVPPYLRDQPTLRLVYQFTSFRVVGGRLGAESYAALIGSLTRLDSLHIYQPIYALGYIFWLAASYLLIKSYLNPSRTIPAITSPIHHSPNLSIPQYLWLPIIFLQPFFLFFFANGNFANFFGICLAVPLVVLIRQYFAPAANPTLSQNPPVPSRTKLFQVALLTNALLATYPELLLPTLALITLLLLQSALHHQYKTLLTQSRRTFLALLLGFLLNPLNTIRGLIGIHSIIKSLNDQPPPDIISGLHPSQLLPALIGMFTWKIHDVQMFKWNLYIIPHPIAWLVTFSLLATLLLGLRRAQDRYLALASLLLFLLQWTAMHLSHFGYGYQKTAQYWSLYFLSILSLGILSALETLANLLRPRSPKDITPLPSPTTHSALFPPHSVLSPQHSVLVFPLLSLAWLIYLMPLQLRDMYLKSQERHITRALYHLATAIPPGPLQQGGSIFLRIETYAPRAINYYANFLPLALQNHPCYYPPIGGPYSYIDGSAKTRYDDLINAPAIPPYLFYGPANHDKLLLLHSHPLVTNSEFTLDHPAAHAYLVSGDYGLEPKFGRWMADTLTIDALNLQPAYLDINVAMRFPNLPLSSYILVILDGQSSSVTLRNNNQATFSIPLTKLGTHRIQIQSPTGAVSPKEAHFSIDPRHFSYLLTRITLDDSPAYPAVIFASTATHP